MPRIGQESARIKALIDEILLLTRLDPHHSQKVVGNLITNALIRTPTDPA